MNTFGPSSSQQYPLISPVAVREHRQRFRREYIPELMRANSLYVPGGRWATKGWILLDRGSYNNINTYSTSLQLNISDTRQANNVKTVKGLSIIHAQCVTRGLANDLNAVYLVELTDARGVVGNKWFQAPLTTCYNIRASAYPDTYHPWSLNNGATWTWQGMIQDMWGKVSGGNNLLGNAPSLPTTPSGTPEGFWFAGVPGWQAISDVLDHLGMIVAVDPTQAPGSQYSIVQIGNADTTFTSLQSKYSTNLEDDLEWIDTGSGRVPGSVIVAFKKRYAVYGTEETVRYDPILQWESGPTGANQTGPYYTVTVNAPSIFATAVGTDIIWSDFTVRYDQDGKAMAADVATAATIATERVTQYYNRIYRGTSGFMTQTYAGALPFATGSLVDGVCWYQDHENPDRWGGWRTQLVRGNFPPWPGMWSAAGYNN